MLRVTESRLTELLGKDIMAARKRADEAGESLSTGLRVNRPSQDPVSWAEGQRAEAKLIASGARGTSMDRARGRLEETEGVFTSLSDIFGRFREMTIQAANSSTNAEARQLMAFEATELRSAALAAANTRGVDGEFLLAGGIGNVKPFDETTGAYSGDGAQRELEISGDTRIGATVPGSRLTAASGVDIFVAMQDFITALNADNDTGVNQAIGDMEQGIEQLSSARAETGTIRNALDQAEKTRSGLELQIQAIRERSVETDSIAAATELSQANAAFESAKTVALRILQMAKV